MKKTDIDTCIKNGYVWSSSGEEPKKHTRNSFTSSGIWLSALDCKDAHTTKLAAQAAIDERKRIARLAEYRKSMEPITPDQANDQRNGDWFYTFDPRSINGISKVTWINIPAEGTTDAVGAYWTREAAEAALAKRKSVESRETPVGETQGKEVVTDETQDAEPMKWAEQKGAGSVCETGEDVSARYITPEWKARQDAKAKQETPKPTTVRGWLETIPDSAIREAAIRQCIKLNDVCSSLDEAIIEIVDWASTDEGIDFWEECFIAAQNNTTWPSYPPKAKQDADGWTKEEIEKAAFKPREWTDMPQHIVSRDPGSKYHRTIHGVSEGTAIVDVYNVLEAFSVTCPACQHAIKKLLCAGLRGKGSRLQDLTEAAASITRAIELEKQRGEGA